MLADFWTVQKYSVNEKNAIYWKLYNFSYVGATQKS